MDPLPLPLATAQKDEWGNQGQDMCGLAAFGRTLGTYRDLHLTGYQCHSFPRREGQAQGYCVQVSRSGWPRASCRSGPGA